MGEFLNRMVELIRKNGREVALYVFAVGGVAAFGEVIGMTSGDSRMFGLDWGASLSFGDGPLAVLFQLAQAAFGLFASYLLVARLLQSENRLSNTDFRILPYLGMSILAWMGMVVGLLLLIVPGLIFATRWVAAAGFLVSEGEGATDSLAKSWLATSGHGWPIFFGGAVLVIFFWVLSAIAIVPLASSIGSLAEFIVSHFVGALTAAVLSSYGIAVFVKLTSPNNELEDVFA